MPPKSMVRYAPDGDVRPCSHPQFTGSMALLPSDCGFPFIPLGTLIELDMEERRVVSVYVAGGPTRGAKFYDNRDLDWECQVLGSDQTVIIPFADIGLFTFLAPYHEQYRSAVSVVPVRYRIPPGSMMDAVVAKSLTPREWFAHNTLNQSWFSPAFVQGLRLLHQGGIAVVPVALEGDDSLLHIVHDPHILLTTQNHRALVEGLSGAFGVDVCQQSWAAWSKRLNEPKLPSLFHSGSPKPGPAFTGWATRFGKLPWPQPLRDVMALSQVLMITAFTILGREQGPPLDRDTDIRLTPHASLPLLSFHPSERKGGCIQCTTEHEYATRLALMAVVRYTKSWHMFTVVVMESPEVWADMCATIGLGCATTGKYHADDIHTDTWCVRPDRLGDTLDAITEAVGVASFRVIVHLPRTLLAMYSVGLWSHMDRHDIRVAWCLVDDPLHITPDVWSITLLEEVMVRPPEQRRAMITAFSGAADGLGRTCYGLEKFNQLSGHSLSDDRVARAYAPYREQLFWLYHVVSTSRLMFGSPVFVPHQSSRNRDKNLRSCARPQWLRYLYNLTKAGFYEQTAAAQVTRLRLLPDARAQDGEAIRELFQDVEIEMVVDVAHDLYVLRHTARTAAWSDQRLPTLRSVLLKREHNGLVGLCRAVYADCRAIVKDPVPVSTQTECTICKETFRAARELTCGHRFCFSCIEQWRGICTRGTGEEGEVREATCPQCRAPFSVDDYRHVSQGSLAWLVRNPFPDNVDLHSQPIPSIREIWNAVPDTRTLVLVPTHLPAWAAYAPCKNVKYTAAWTAFAHRKDGKYTALKRLENKQLFIVSSTQLHLDSARAHAPFDTIISLDYTVDRQRLYALCRAFGLTRAPASLLWYNPGPTSMKDTRKRKAQ